MIPAGANRTVRSGEPFSTVVSRGESRRIPGEKALPSAGFLPHRKLTPE